VATGVPFCTGDSPGERGEHAKTGNKKKRDSNARYIHGESMSLETEWTLVRPPTIKKGGRLYSVLKRKRKKKNRGDLKGKKKKTASKWDRRGENKIPPPIKHGADAGL